MEQFYQEAITGLKNNRFNEREWARFKREIAQKYKLKSIPTNIQILINCPLEDIKTLKPKLITKPVRTLSGVSPIAIMTKPDRCPHGKCTYCPGGLNSQWGDVPQSYTGHEPATMRGIRNNYDAYLQIFNRLEQYVLLGHSFDKIEIIVMGGTFTAAEKEYQEEFIKDTFQAMNDFSELFYTNKNFDYIKFKEFFELPGDIYDKARTKSIQDKLRKFKSRKETSLEKEQLKNETSHVRCVALCIETKPDWGLLKHGNEMLRQGCTRVELGIQSVYDDVLKAVNRGHTSKDSIQSIRELRDLGFKINFHYMPGLPLTDKVRDLQGMKELFSNPDYKPDMLKIYPCMVAEGTPLYKQYQEGKFSPISTDEAAELILKFKHFVPEYCRIQRVQRDVPTKMWKAGVDKTNLRQHIFDNNKVECRCIRCREPKNKEIDFKKVELKVDEYEASKGKEFFISMESEDILLGFARLRFPSQCLREEITDKTALIRELHVYGTATKIGNLGDVQHKGLGKKLMEKAEEIAKNNKKDKMVVISGVGVKKYYEKLGYKKEGPYMVKGI